MKRFLLLIPIILLVLLNACSNNSANTAATQTAAAQTQTAQAWTSTPGPSPTFDSASPSIFNYLNLAIEHMETSDKFHQLEHITGASYQVTRVEFPQENNVSTIFRVEARCECAANAQCCSPTRTFVVTLNAMDDLEFRERIIQLVPPTVRNLEVQTFDHGTPTNLMSVPWANVQSFLRNQISGFELASEVEIR